MYKEIVITIIIVAVVAVGDVVSQRYTIKCSEEMKNDLNILREDIISKNDENINTEIKDLEKKWKEFQNVLVFYLEHDELEKVVAQLSSIKGYIDVNEVETAVPEIDKCIFLLDHIVDKEAFNFKNIF